MGSTSLFAQEESDKLRLSGSIQSDMLLAQKDSTTGAEATDGRFVTRMRNLPWVASTSSLALVLFSVRMKSAAWG